MENQSQHKRTDTKSEGLYNIERNGIVADAIFATAFAHTGRNKVLWEKYEHPQETCDEHREEVVKTQF